MRPAAALRLLVACAGILLAVFASTLPIACTLEDLQAATGSVAHHHEHPAGNSEDTHREHCAMCQAPTTPPMAPVAQGPAQPPLPSEGLVTARTWPRLNPVARRATQPRAPPTSSLA
jgi:hypothetical protein